MKLCDYVIIYSPFKNKNNRIKCRSRFCSQLVILNFE